MILRFRFSQEKEPAAAANSDAQKDCPYRQELRLPGIVGGTLLVLSFNNRCRINSWIVQTGTKGQEFSRQRKGPDVVSKDTRKARLP